MTSTQKAEPTPTPPTLDAAFEAATDDGPLLVEPDGDSRLAQLHALYADAKAEAAAADAKLKTIVDALKNELFAAVPDGTEKIELRGVNGLPLRMTYVVTNRFDSTSFKKVDPATYERYLKPSGSWTLKAVTP